MYRIGVSKIFHLIFLLSDDLFSCKTNGVENLTRKKSVLKSVWNISLIGCRLE